MRIVIALLVAINVALSAVTLWVVWPRGVDLDKLDAAFKAAEKASARDAKCEIAARGEMASLEQGAEALAQSIWRERRLSCELDRQLGQ